MSTSFGVAPRRETAPAVAKNENVGVMTSSPGPTPSAISATSSASVPDDRPTAWPTPMYPAISRSNPSTSGPPMKRWLSQTRAMAASSRSRSGPYWPCKSSKGTGIRSAADDFRRTPERQVVAIVGRLAAGARTRVQDDFHVLAGIGGQVDHHRNPAALGGVLERVQRLLEQ